MIKEMYSEEEVIGLVSKALVHGGALSIAGVMTYCILYYVLYDIIGKVVDRWM